MSVNAGVHECGYFLLSIASVRAWQNEKRWERAGKEARKKRRQRPPYLGVSGSGGSITFSVIHDSTIRANHTLHRSHLVAWPT